MSKDPLVVPKIVPKQLTVADTAAEYGISRGHLHMVILRYRLDGLDALDPRSRRPKSDSATAANLVRQRIIGLRPT